MYNPIRDGRWSRSRKAQERIGKRRFLNRHLIKRDTPVLDGVYIFQYSGEAIIVDANSPILQKLYDIIYQSSGWDEHSIIKTTYDAIWLLFTKKQAEIDAQHQTDLAAPSYIEVVNELAEQFYGDREVSLDLFLETKIGVCRHRALAVAALLEMFKEEGLISGQISIDRSGKDEYGDGGHAWARYTDEDGVVWILDASMDYFGRLMDSPPDGWEYFRPTDKRKPDRRAEARKRKRKRKRKAPNGGGRRNPELGEENIHLRRLIDQLGGDPVFRAEQGRYDLHRTLKYKGYLYQIINSRGRGGYDVEVFLPLRGDHKFIDEAHTETKREARQAAKRIINNEREKGGEYSPSFYGLFHPSY